jgi:hypothetical protein
LSATRVQLQRATAHLDEALEAFILPELDESGAERRELLEFVDDEIGEAALSLKAALDVYPDIDPDEGEPEIPEEDGHDESDEEVGKE